MEATEQEMREAIEDSANGLEMLASSYRDVLQCENSQLLKYTYEMVVESENLFHKIADRMETTAAPTAASETSE